MTTASRVSDSRVTDAAKTLISIVKRRNYSTLVYSPENIEALTAACVLEAAMACQGPVVRVNDLSEVVSKMDKVGDMLDEMGSYSYTAVEDIVYSYQLDLGALIAKANGHE